MFISCLCVFILQTPRLHSNQICMDFIRNIFSPGASSSYLLSPLCYRCCSILTQHVRGHMRPRLCSDRWLKCFDSWVRKVSETYRFVTFWRLFSQWTNWAWWCVIYLKFDKKKMLFCCSCVHSSCLCVQLGNTVYYLLASRSHDIFKGIKLC